MKKLENEFKETIINIKNEIINTQIYNVILIKKQNNFATTSGKIIMNLCLINSN